MPGNLKAGSAAVDISPVDSQFLWGYPHVERYSTGIHDRLWASALFLTDGQTPMIFIGNDILYIPKSIAVSVRKKIEKATGVSQNNIMLSATHTHSGPITTNYLCSRDDTIIPSCDEKYIAVLEAGIVKAAVTAVKSAVPAKVGLTIVDASCVGLNRRNPSGPTDPQMPVLAVKNAITEQYLAVMVICSMHPTVLHEDSKLVSGDFPGMSRIFLQSTVVGEQCVVIHHSGPCGNQSPRYIARENIFAEAIRLGNMLGKNIEKGLAFIKYTDIAKITCASSLVELPLRLFPDIATAKKRLNNAIVKLKYLRDSNAPRFEVRTAECDWFGAEENLALSKAADNGQLKKVADTLMPAEIQVFSINDWNFVGWPCEIFTEYSLTLKAKLANTFVITFANGELQGYIVTQTAAEEDGYEACNAMFAPESGDILIKKTFAILNQYL